ncbi:MAG: hypothetical protein PWP23_1829 [Candidatus Sumerlaeota bacterium]|nr:hypothetical protein [Candidatus Sumerlaeota bacterium]
MIHSPAFAFSTTSRHRSTLVAWVLVFLFPISQAQGEAPSLETFLDQVVRQSSEAVAKIQSYEYDLDYTCMGSNGTRVTHRGHVIGQGPDRFSSVTAVYQPSEGSESTRDIITVLNEEYFALNFPKTPQIFRYERLENGRLSEDAESMRNAHQADVMIYFLQMGKLRPAFGEWLSRLREKSHLWKLETLSPSLTRIHMDLEDAIRYECVVDAEASFLPVQIRQFVLLADGSWTETFEFEIEYTRAQPGNLLSPSFVRTIFHTHEGEFQEETTFRVSNFQINKSYRRSQFQLGALNPKGVSVVVTTDPQGQNKGIEGAVVEGTFIKGDYHPATQHLHPNRPTPPTPLPPVSALPGDPTPVAKPVVPPGEDRRQIAAAVAH